ncbi:hypothetical protein [Methylobacterium frigidaeris]|uniref:Uncharacterized protein n=1 Tax=Methylobacterium frigidaeris TaxID=2038277 RepID=A0AA37HJW6_9HYPH|nr:hypothetical protein [Methylobacterium frigidaeris]PIK73043.1 hypothetical protein CS379_10610 [Methylobacterium frigidaeris]GJD66876.1 hypothetical protein MPEAHAMD_7075 [Methylobacterium frigidaeris]
MTEALARGWLLAWIVFGAAPAGSLVLLLIHRITGGRWGEALAPCLRPAAALLPLVALGFLGVVVALPLLYPWAADPGTVKPDVASLYLNTALFAVRGAITLLGWSLLAGLVLAGRCTRLVAGLGLAFYGLTISLVPVDWILSLEPRFTSSAFGAGIALHQLLAALALAAVVSPSGLDAETAPDLANLLLATLLGVLYIGLMSYVVAWYGDLPPNAAYYLRREAGPYSGLIGAAVATGGLVPFLFLLVGAVRRSPGGLRLVGLLVLVGLVLRFCWLVVPAWGADADGAAVAAGLWLTGLVVVALLSLRLVARFGGRLGHA